MPLPTISGVARVTVRGTVDGGTGWQNTWHILGTTRNLANAADRAAVHAIFRRIYFGANIGTGHHITQEITARSSVQDFVYTPLDGISASAVITDIGVGGAGGSSMPAEVAEVLTLRTANRGRSYRGRIYFPAFCAADFDASGLLDASVPTNLVTQVDGVNALMIADGSRIVVASYLHSTAEPVTAFTMDTKADVQRRRK